MSESDARQTTRQVFATQQERVRRHGTFLTQPPGFRGLILVAKHHAQHQGQLLGMLGATEPKSLATPERGGRDAGEARRVSCRCLT